jgi:hypothetical protein
MNKSKINLKIIKIDNILIIHQFLTNGILFLIKLSNERKYVKKKL